MNSSSVAIESIIRLVAGLAATDPTALDLLNTDKSIREIHKIKGAPPAMLNSPENVNEKRKMRAEQQAKQEAQQDMSVNAQNAQVMSETSTDGGNLLSDAMGG